MTEMAVASTAAVSSTEAGRELGDHIKSQLGGRPPDAMIVFASTRHELRPFLTALQEAAAPATLVGCTSAGEFTSDVAGEGLACAVGLRSADMEFHAAVTTGLTDDRAGAAARLVSSFKGETGHAYRSALVLADALAGHADDLVAELTSLTGGRYQFFGGGAGGDGSFQKRFVFHGTEPLEDAAVALEILSHKPIGIGVRHGWSPVGRGLRVTAADGMRLRSLNARPAVEVFEEHARDTGQAFDRADPLPFFLHNVLGMDSGVGYKLRVPLGVETDGTVVMATEVPSGAMVRLMTVDKESAALAARASVEAAVERLDGAPAAGALFFDCVATRLRMGSDFGFELDAVRGALAGAKLAGCNSIGQIARADGQLTGFHNCTAVVAVFPR